LEEVGPRNGKRDERDERSVRQTAEREADHRVSLKMDEP